ncbi:exonuclease family protein, partial [Escherichia coli EC1850]
IWQKLIPSQADS